MQMVTFAKDQEAFMADSNLTSCGQYFNSKKG